MKATVDQYGAVNVLGGKLLLYGPYTDEERNVIRRLVLLGINGPSGGAMGEMSSRCRQGSHDSCTGLRRGAGRNTTCKCSCHLRGEM